MMLAQPTSALFIKLIRDIHAISEKVLYLHPRTVYRKMMANTNSNGTCSPRKISAIEVEFDDINTSSHLPTIRKSFAATTLSKSTVTSVLIIPTRLSFFSSLFSSFAATDLVVEESALPLPFVELAVVSD